MSNPLGSETRHGQQAAAPEVGAPFDADLNAVYWEDRPEGLRVVLVGEIDLTNHARLKEAQAKVESSDPAGLTVDLSNATFIDSTTLGFFAKFSEYTRAAGHQLTLYAPQRAVLRALTIVGFDRVMKIVPADPQKRPHS
jgi:anti-sigma B factor antagonist